MFRDPTCSTFRKGAVALVFGVGVFLIPNVVQSASSNSATLQWAANQESDLAGYRVYHGTNSGSYGGSQNVGMTTTYQYVNLESNKTHYFAVTAYDTSGNESSPSPEVYKTITGPNSLLTISLSGSGTVTSNPVGVSCSSGTCSGTFPQGSNVTLNAVPSSGSTFSGWGGVCTGTSSCVVALSTSSLSASASFALNPPPSSSLSVTIAGGGSGTVTSNPVGVSCSSGTCSGAFPQGTNVTLNAVPSSGSTFSGWGGVCTGTSSCVVALSTSSLSTSATFSSNQTVSHSLSVSLNGDGNGSVKSQPSGLTCSGGTCTGSFTQGTKVTLTAITQEGTVFEGWNGICSGTSSCGVTLMSPQTVSAMFKIENTNTPPTPTFPVRVNFQPSNSQIPKDYKKDDGSVFSSTRGYGWNKLVNGTEKKSSADQTLDTFVSTANLNPGIWNFSIPNGTYYVTMVLGDPQNAQGPHWVEAEGLQVAKRVKTSKGEYLTIVDYPVEVKDTTLSIKLGDSGQGQTVMNYLLINSKPSLAQTTQILAQSFGTTLISSAMTSGSATKINPTMLVRQNKKKKEQDALAVAAMEEQKKQEMAKLDSLKDRISAAKKSGGPATLRNLLGGF